MAALAKFIELKQIAAAKRLHQRLEQWRLIERALASLKLRFPEFSLEETLLKVTCVNALYRTNVLAIHRLVKHAVEVLRQADLTLAGPELIEELAVPPQSDGKVHRHHSFGSKFAHFFIDSERIPIMDSYAVNMIKFHLERTSMALDPNRPYVAFCANHSLLKGELGFPITNKDLDHFLWIAGLYKVYCKKRNAPINREVHAMFENQDLSIVADLADLLPPVTSGRNA